VVARGARLRRVAGLARDRRRIVRAVAPTSRQEVAAMTRYVTVRLTLVQAMAASNACDLIRDSYEADGNKREAAQYQRAHRAIDEALRSVDKERS
jgi:hypothetical protein